MERGRKSREKGVEGEGSQGLRTKTRTRGATGHCKGEIQKMKLGYGFGKLNKGGKKGQVDGYSNSDGSWPVLTAH